MPYDATTKVLTIDFENETFDDILDNVAIALKDYRVTNVAGVLARDIGILCTSPNINKWAKYKPENIDKIIDITDADRANNGYSMAIDLDGISLDTELPITFIRSISRIEPEKHYRIGDFHGYDHYTRSQLQLSQDEVDSSTNTHHINIWTGSRPNGVPLDESIEQMWNNALSYGYSLSDLVEFGWMVITYSGFVRASGVIATTFSALRAALQASSAQYAYTPYYDFLLEPKGREGKLIVYGRNVSKTNYMQLLTPCLIKKPGSIHPVEISGWSPLLKIGTTTTGFNITYKQWTTGDHKGQYIMFGTDDDLYFDFTIRNNASVSIYGGFLYLALTIGNTTYYSLFSDDSSSAFSGAFNIAPGESYGPYTYTIGNVIYTRPRFFVQLSSLLTANPTLGNKTKFDATFSVYYTEAKTGPLISKPGLEAGLLVSSFTLPMQCTGATVTNPIDPPSDIKPTPPNWDVEIQD